MLARAGRKQPTQDEPRAGRGPHAHRDSPMSRRLTEPRDFGDPGFREPLGVLLRSLREEAELDVLGRYAMRRWCLDLSCNRLWIQDTRARHPEIHDVAIRKPCSSSAGRGPGRRCCRTCSRTRRAHGRCCSGSSSRRHLHPRIATRASAQPGSSSAPCARCRRPSMSRTPSRRPRRKRATACSRTASSPRCSRSSRTCGRTLQRAAARPARHGAPDPRPLRVRGRTVMRRADPGLARAAPAAQARRPPLRPRDFRARCLDHRSAVRRVPGLRRGRARRVGRMAVVAATEVMKGDLAKVAEQPQLVEVLDRQSQQMARPATPWTLAPIA